MVKTPLTFIAAFAGFASSAGASVITVSPSSTVTQVGGLVTVSIRIADVANLFAWEFDVGYDAAVLRPVSGGTEGSFFAGGPTFFLAGDLLNAGEVDFVSDSLEGNVPGVSGTGGLVDLSFNAIGIGTSSLTILANSDLFLFDSSLDPISTEIAGGSVVVESAVPTVPEPSTFALLLSVSAVALGFHLARGRA